MPWKYQNFMKNVIRSKFPICSKMTFKKEGLNSTLTPFPWENQKFHLNFLVIVTICKNFPGQLNLQMLFHKCETLFVYCFENYENLSENNLNCQKRVRVSYFQIWSQMMSFKAIISVFLVFNLRIPKIISDNEKKGKRRRSVI